MNQIEKLKNELERRLSELPVGNIAVHGNLESHFRRAELISMRNFIESMEKEPQDMGEVSDGYHTFNELYYYRMLYNAAFFNLLPKSWVHKSKRHHTGEECFGGGWFIVMANLPTGQVSNHYELKDWDLFKVPEKEFADEWDGHTPREAAERIKKYLQLTDTLEDKIKRATESWKGVDVDEFMDDVRGREQQEQPNNMIQWTGNNLKEVIDFTGKSPKFGEWFKSWDELESYVHSHGNILKLFSDDGSHFEVPVGAWIVKTPDGYNVPSVARFIHVKQEQPQLPGIEDHGIPGKDFIPVEWVDACEMYGKWKIVKLDKPEADIEKEITEHAINMSHCEFSHDSEDREHEEWAMKEFRHFYELGLNAIKED